jgi:hypothetical protein
MALITLEPAVNAKTPGGKDAKGSGMRRGRQASIYSPSG